MFWLSIKRAEDCLFSRRLGYEGKIIKGYSVCLRLFGKDIFRGKDLSKGELQRKIEVILNDWLVVNENSLGYNMGIMGKSCASEVIVDYLFTGEITKRNR